MRKLLIPVVAVLMLQPCIAVAQFSGKFALEPEGCRKTGSCSLTYDFAYVDSQNVGWQAAANNVTDGASIPKWAQPFVGDPFDESFIKAAVLHDHYCVRHVRPWRATHRMFYDALLASDVPQNKAKLMYYAVFLAGPKWVKLIPGKPCSAGSTCTFEFEFNAQDEPDIIDSSAFITRSASYDDPKLTAELSETEKMINETADLTLEQLESRARSKRPGDFFYENDGEISLGDGLAVE